MINNDRILEIITIRKKRLNIEKGECFRTAIRRIQSTGIIMRLMNEKAISVFDFSNISKLYFSESGIKNDNNLSMCFPRFHIPIYVNSI
jgi:hypothetical protein